MFSDMFSARYFSILHRGYVERTLELKKKRKEKKRKEKKRKEKICFVDLGSQSKCI
jgi:hypothetical protein